MKNGSVPVKGADPYNVSMSAAHAVQAIGFCCHMTMFISVSMCSGVKNPHVK